MNLKDIIGIKNWSGIWNMIDRVDEKIYIFVKIRIY